MVWLLRAADQNLGLFPEKVADSCGSDSLLQLSFESLGCHDSAKNYTTLRELCKPRWPLSCDYHPESQVSGISPQPSIARGIPDKEQLVANAARGTMGLLTSNGLGECMQAMHFQTSTKLLWAIGYCDVSLIMFSVRSGILRDLPTETQHQDTSYTADGWKTNIFLWRAAFALFPKAEYNLNLSSRSSSNRDVVFQLFSHDEIRNIGDKNGVIQTRSRLVCVLQYISIVQEISNVRRVCRPTSLQCVLCQCATLNPWY